jgi:uncharacterized membrane protein YhaH (DUF805 family)
MSLVQILFGFNGRIRRTTYWLAYLGFVVAVMVVMGVAIGALAGVASVTRGAAEEAAAGGFVVIYLLSIPISLWVGFALMIKRCHDRDYPGVMSLISLVPLVGSLWALIDLGFIDGTPGPNRYGPSPKGLGGPTDDIFT